MFSGLSWHRLSGYSRKSWMPAFAGMTWGGWWVDGLRHAVWLVKLADGAALIRPTPLAMDVPMPIGARVFLLLFLQKKKCLLPYAASAFGARGRTFRFFKA
jgi:hypothetical protein